MGQNGGGMISIIVFMNVICSMTTGIIAPLATACLGSFWIACIL